MDSNKPTLTGVKKRQQIHQANKVVFIWVAIAGVVLAVAVVLAQVMVKQFIYNTKVISAQQTTNTTLVNNEKQYEPLRVEVSKLIANQRLNDLRVNKVDGGDNALQVVIDAMPTTGDPLATAASISQSVLSQSGVRIEQLSFVDGSTAAVDPSVTQTAQTAGIVEMPFSVKVSGTYDQIKKMLDDMQLSIRPFSVTSIKLSGVSSNMTAEVNASTYYAVPPTTDLTKKPVKL